MKRIRKFDNSKKVLYLTKRNKMKEDLSQALKELEKSLNELKTAFEEVRQAIRNEPT